MVAPPYRASQVVESPSTLRAGTPFERHELVRVDFSVECEEAMKALRAAGVLPDGSSASVAALDHWLDSMLGVEPVQGDARLRAAVHEVTVGAYLGETFAKRLGGQWRVDCEVPIASRVVWRSGFSTCPFTYYQKRVEHGAAWSVHRQFERTRERLVERADIPSCRNDALEWLMQADHILNVTGRRDVAARFAKKALLLKPGWAEPHVRLAEWLTGPESREHLEHALEADPKLGRAWRLKASWLLEAGRLEEALSSVQRAIKHQPKEPSGQVLCAEILVRAGRMADALHAVERGLQLDARSARCWERKAECLAALGRHEEAAVAYGRAAEAGMPAAHFLRACSLERSGRPEKALEIYRHVVEIASSCKPETVQTARQRIAELEADPELLMDRANRLASEGTTEEAIERYDQVLRAAPTYAAAWREKGVQLALMGNLDEALVCLARATELAPADLAAWIHRVASLGRGRRFAEGLRVVEQALKHCPRDPRLLARRGFFLAKLDRFAEGLEALEEAREVDPDAVDIYLFRAEVERRLGRTDDAIASLKEGVARAPGITTKGLEARRLLWHLEHPGRVVRPDAAARIAEQAFREIRTSRDPVLALSLLRDATELNPFSAETWNSRGTCALKLGMADEALMSFDRALDLSPRLPALLQNRATALLVLGRLEEALACHEEVLAKSPQDQRSLRGRQAVLEGLQRRSTATGARRP